MIKDQFPLAFSMLKKGMEIGPEHRRFRLIKPVSNSPIGQVWHAEEVAGEGEEGEIRALEVVNPALLKDQQTLDDFKKLVTQARQLRHKHIARTEGYFQSREGWVFVAMEPVSTRSLARILMEDGYAQLSVEKARVILTQIALAVDYAAKQRVSHGDLTPWNVIITPESGVKLVNFAFRQPLLRRIQEEGHRVLNNEYHAPEAFISVPLPATADIYSFACIAYQLCAGFPPFAAETPVHERDPETLPPPKLMSEEQWAVLKPALSENPANRPATALALVQALFPASASKPAASASTTRAAGSNDQPVARHRRQAGIGKTLATAASMFALGLLVGWLVASQQYETRDNKLLDTLAEIHQLMGTRPTTENKVRINTLYAEIRTLAPDSPLLEALGARVDEYKVRLTRDLGDKQVPGSPAAIAARSDYPEGAPEIRDPAFLPGAIFKDEIMPDVFGPNMVVLPAGEFLMGDQDGGGDDNEKPVHLVKIARPFAISQKEVTFAEYDLFALTTNRPLPDDEGWGRGDRPVINVSWNDANAYAYWLRKQTGLNYRLPTEAEWEYAARAGTEGPYWWGNDIGKGNANCAECGSLWDGKKTAPVGSFKPNPFGLYDMNGNVYEWVSDCYNDTYVDAPTDGSSWDVGQCNLRVMRGGSWFDIARLARSASRYRHPPNATRNSWGFRLALDLE